MTKLALTVPTTGELNTIAEPKVDTSLSTIQTWANGEIEGINNLAAEGVKETNLDTATKALLNTKSFAALTFNEQSGATFTAATGELVLMATNASVLTLPTATANRIVGVFAGNSVTSMTVKAPVVNTIFGDFITAATTITLTKLRHVILQATGTSWLIIAGEPARTQTITVVSKSKAEAETGTEPSATRQAYVTLSTAAAELSGLAIGAEGPLIAASGVKGISLFINPTQKWKATVAVTASTLLL